MPHAFPILPLALAVLTLAGCTSPSASEGGGTASGERSAAAATAGDTSASDPTAATPQAPGGEAATQCDASKAQSVVGQKHTDALAAQAQVAAGAKTVRRLVPGQAVTMEFNGERLNLETDASGVIVAVRCG